MRDARRVAAGVLLAAIACLAPAAYGQATDASYGDRFDVAWRLVAERYWDLARLAVDWPAAREHYRPLALAADDDDGFFAVLEALYARIGDDHSVFVPPARVAEMRERFGDLPCLGVFGAVVAHPPAPGAGLIPSDLARVGPVDFGLIAPDVGYLRLTDLARDGTAEATREAVVQLQRRGATTFVLDLRGNPGGRLVTMMQVAGVFTRGFLWRTITTWSLPLPYPAIGVPATAAPLAVLVDGDVHSAAEGLAGALQAQGRAIVVGHRTAGNVEAVMPFCLRDGSQAWIATGVLAPLRGPTWAGVGVVPDVAADRDAALAAAVAAVRERR